MSTLLIETTNLTKKFKNLTVLKNLNIKIEKEKVYLLVGENGSGKSTFIKLLTGEYAPTSGFIKRYYKSFSYVPEALIYNQKIKVYTYLNKVTKLLKVKRDLELEKYLELETNKYLKNLSKGNQKKILLYLAFLKDNEIVYLDEPLDSLDKTMKEKVVNLIKDNKKITYIISSHNEISFKNIKNKEVISFD